MRIVSLHGRPIDPSAFDSYYRHRHMPLVQGIPGVRNIRFGKVIRTADGLPPPYYVVSDVYFDGPAALDAALGSPEMKDAIDDVPHFATGGVTIMFCEYEDFAPLPMQQPR